MKFRSHSVTTSQLQAGDLVYIPYFDITSIHNSSQGVWVELTTCKEVEQNGSLVYCWATEYVTGNLGRDGYADTIRKGKWVIQGNDLAKWEVMTMENVINVKFEG